mmetsp:Transcript_60731/g.131637  ORF Transcript_60731/g.131637 Transcript_60731/m.131637 type:complete len:892 (-) Transcript_60731:293-2968(-)
MAPASASPPEPAWHVHKFGGTSVGSATCFQRVLTIIKNARRENVRLAIVVSAMGGKPKTTDMLIQLTTHAADNNWQAVDELLAAIRAKHDTCLRELFKDCRQAQDDLCAAVERDLGEIMSLLSAVRVMRLAHESIVGIVSGYGEQWSAQFLQRLLQEDAEAGEWSYLDARRALLVDGGSTPDVNVLWQESTDRLEAILKEEAGRGLVITGFIASSRNGGGTTLGRDGSDFSASVFGRLLGAEQISIWTDVSGVLSADPRKVPDAYSIPEVSYKEAAELAYFGAKVVHPKTMLPAFARSDWIQWKHSIPIFIKNTFAPDDPGTRISESHDATQGRPAVVCGFTTMDNMALVSVEGLGMQGVPGVASRLFHALHAAGISIVMIAQASSEMSICYLIEQKHAELARKATGEAFSREIAVGTIESVEITCPCTVVSAVGDAMPQTAGVAGKFFQALGHAAVNVLAIAQGRNQRNLSAVVEAKDSVKALVALHSTFLTVVPVAFAVVGAGGIAEALLSSFGSLSTEMVENFGVDFRLIALCDPPDHSGTAWQANEERRGRVALAEAGERLCPSSVLSGLAEHGEKVGAGTLPIVEERLRSSPLLHKVVIDCSDSKETAGKYEEWMRQGWHVVSQNFAGLLNAGGHPPDISASSQMMETRPSMLVGAAVGRGLPVLPVLTTLAESGDRITRLEGVFSTSLHSLCTLASPADGSDPLSFDEACRRVAAKGFFGEDRDVDLDGQTAYLQLMIIAREICGYTAVPKIKVEPVSEAALAAKPDKPDMVLRYTGEFEVKTMQGAVRLVWLPRNDPLAQLQSGNRMVRFFTQRRGPENPVVVSGPVGCELVADALLADSQHLAQRLGAKKARKLSPGEVDPARKRLFELRKQQSSHKITHLGD